MKKKKLLIFIDWYKPGYKAGGPIRSISNLVDYLKDDISIHIITTNTDYMSDNPYTNIESNTWQIVDGAKVFYLSNDLISKKKIKDLIIEINPTIIYCNSLYSKYFTLFPISIAKKLNIQSVLAVRGMLSEGSLGVKSFKKKVFLKLIKTLKTFNLCTFHATNENEKNDIQKAFGDKANIIVAQNLPELKEQVFYSKEKTIGLLKMTFVGRIANEKNLLYAIESLKKVKSSIEFDIYGPIYSNEYWEKCKNTINLLPKNIVVNYKKVLPHNKLDSILKNYHVLFLPSTGENFGHIIVEAMMNSCIPLISDKTPWNNLQEKNIGFDLPLEKPETFSGAIDKLASLDDIKLNEIAKNAHNYAVQIINNDKLVEDYYKLFQLKN